MSTSLCHAPSVGLHFNPDGSVRPCCVHEAPLGNISTQRLGDIWDGSVRASLEAMLANGTFPAPCWSCESEVGVEGRAGSYPALFDSKQRTIPIEGSWPTWIEFNLSNSCNLQCIQCDGDQSSAIRAHREHRAPLVSPYGDEFFDDLVPFLVRLEHAQFAGGEPFLARENFRVWDLIAEHAPHVECVTVTNSTVWSPRVERAVHQVRMGFTLSIDSVDKAMFEAIRVGADFDGAMRNADRFIAISRERGTPISVNHCLMPQNIRGFADVLSWADERDVDVQVSVVRNPARCSIARLPPAELLDVQRWLEDRSDEVTASLGRNRRVWVQEMARITAWAAATNSAANRANGATNRATDDRSDAGAHPPERSVTISARPVLRQQVLGLAHIGTPVADDVAAAADLRSWSGQPVHTVTVVQDDRVHSVSDGLAELLGRSADQIIGSPIEDFSSLMQGRFGRMASYTVTESSPDRTDAVAQFETAHARIALVAIRDDRGVAVSGRLLLAIRPA